MPKQQEKMKECIDHCNACRDECERTLFQTCLKMGGEHAGQEHVQLMADCIEICQAAANFMLRGSGRHAYICEVCAEICGACAESCETIGGDDMERCAEICRDCAESCREMSKDKPSKSARRGGEQAVMPA